MRIRLAYGRQGLWIDLPDGAPTTIIEPRFVPGLPDEPAAIVEALRSPLGARPLRELVRPHDTVAIVFSDLTRPVPNDRILPPLLNELASAGAPDENIVLINALGTHRPQTNDELKQMLGSEIVGRYRIVQHNAWNNDNLIEAARNRAGRVVRVNRAYMQASVRILTGLIEPHFFAGLSGGPKAVLPGLADIQAILDNHSGAMLAAPQATWAVTEANSAPGCEGNPVWQEMLAVAQSARPTFILNVTLNRDKQITGVFAGDMVAAHRAGADFVRRHARQPAPHPFDIVITTNSGYPLDLNLYQSVKGMSAAAQIVKPGGDIIIAAECWDGIPDHGEYKKLLWSANSPQELLDKVMAPGFCCHDQWEAQIQAQIQLKANVHVYAGGLTDEELRRALVIPCRSIEERVARLRRHKPQATIAVLPEGPQTVPYLANRAGGSR